MDRPAHYLKDIANRLANTLTSDGSADVLSLLAQCNPTEPSECSAARPNEQNNCRVGIWERRTEGGQTQFIRRAGIEPWHLWSETGTIRLQPNVRRVLLLGESVARGFFYDPHFNPALALSMALDGALGTGTTEVVDLARISLEQDQLIALTESCFCLEPSAIVVFAGNNWNPLTSLTQCEAREAASRLRQSGEWSCLKSVFENQLSSRVTRYIERMSRLSEKHNVPLVFVVPEFNLVDWHDSGNPPLLDARKQSEWLCAKTSLMVAIADGDAGKTARLARRMLELDGGTSPIPLRALAELAREHCSEAARTLFEQARDACGSIPFPAAPRCYSITQETIRRECGRKNIAVVDLPSLFESRLGGALPDRKLFLDYCHLTASGIAIAMGGVARVLSSVLGKREICQAEAEGSIRLPGPAIMAQACFQAAVYNARLGQPDEVVARHCSEAMNLWPPVADLMRLYLDSHLRKEPTVLCHSFDELVMSQRLSAMNVWFTEPQSRKALYPTLVRAIRQCCPDDENAETLLDAGHSVGRNSINLLDRRYCARTGASFEEDWPDRAAFYQAFESRSEFTFFTARPAYVRLFLTYRSQAGEVAGNATLRVNGKEIASFPALTSWADHTFQLSRETLLEGFNTLLIDWPALRWDTNKRIESISRTFELQTDDKPALKTFYPVYADIFRLDATCVAA
jgi:hypothetical protein